MTEPRTGDTPLPPGAAPRHVDTSGEVSVEPQGDRPLPGYVGPVEVYDRPHPTAGELRAAGYVVAEAASGPVPDDQTPGLYYSSTPTANPPQPGTPGTGDTPLLSGITEVERHEYRAPTWDEEGKFAGYAPASAEEPATGGESEPDEHEAQGRAAAEAGEARQNPYDGRTAAGKAWAKGYDAVKERSSEE